MDAPLKILSISSEVAPYAKTGGLADVCDALPRALRSLGHDVRLALPRYGTISAELIGERSGECQARFDGHSVWGAWYTATLPDADVPVYFIEHNDYFDRPALYDVDGTEFPDNLERYCFFSLAILDAVAQMGWKPDIVHCHDWHTAAIPAYLKTRFAYHPMWTGVPTVFTIHNMAYQGRYSSSLIPKTGLGWELFTPKYLEFYGDLNLMKAGIIFSSKLNTVSKTYAKEIQTEVAGHGLEGVLRTRSQDLSGIPNGVDTHVWNPSTDSRLAARFDAQEQAGKRTCKEVLQQRAGLPVSNAPLFAMVTRLVADKGIDMLLTVLPELLKKDMQLVILGSGDPFFEQALHSTVAAYPEKAAVHIGYDHELAHLIYAGSDFYLMPSRTEPCGLSQIYAMLYGSIPIVHHTGGLADTVTEATPTSIKKGTGTGFVFKAWSEQAFLRSVTKALSTYKSTDKLEAIRANGMRQDFSWKKSAQAYVDLFRRAIAAP